MTDAERISYTANIFNLFRYALTAILGRLTHRLRAIIPQTSNKLTYSEDNEETNILLLLAVIYCTCDQSKSGCCLEHADVDFSNYPECDMKVSCIFENMNILRNSTLQIDRDIHDFKCLIFRNSTVYEIPSGIFLTLKSNITHLYANHVGIAELRRISFPFGDKLRVVDLSGNKIKKIVETVFYDAPKLEILNLSDNQISYFSSNAFEKLTSLKILNLSRNEITKIPYELFQPLNGIIFLNLRFNRLELKYGIFPDMVKSLDLSYNNIEFHHKFKIFALLNNLETLSLHGNRIENIHPSIFESNLKFLGISDNNFACNTLADIFLAMRENDVFMGLCATVTLSTCFYALFERFSINDVADDFEIVKYDPISRNFESVYDCLCIR
ncbi:CLUMA_CG013468, isoform A [Clunio marinus]|uniref:CLUMA_CG013468, isoform A n=1 Tax=Clunio marinus TaxID=568069 RepID=A0A1J1IKA9_9DIPT|nr:CLUMA_CG013468, isoform A [Clunio marinus]